MTTHPAATAGSSAPSLRQALASGATLLGTFVKTTHYQTVEVLAGSGLDFVVLDAEHAPFGRETLDACCLAARAHQFPALVRTASNQAEHILQALDCGAQGVLVPHVDDAQSAADAVGAARYREAGGRRGFSNSPRAGGYGAMPLAAHIDASDRQTTVVVQIETAMAVENVDDIAQVPGVDALFIGRADLAVSYGAASLDHPDVSRAVARICRVAQDRRIPVGVFLPDTREVHAFMQLGATLFVIGSDQGMLKRAASEVVKGRA